MCNLFTGSGFEMGFLDSFSMAWLGLVLMAFIIMFARKWINEEAGIAFNWIFAGCGAGLAYLITISLSCSFKFALLLGFIGLIIGGFGIGFFIDSEGGGEY